MSYQRFTGYRPGVKYDNLPWLTVEINESDTEDGTYTLIDTQPLVPVDANPLKPARRSFVTYEATLTDGWYILTFVDADGNRQDTAPVHRGDTTAGLYYCTPDEVRTYLGVTQEQLSDESLALPIRKAQEDIDAACGAWTVYEDTGLKFASDDLELDDITLRLLSDATCAQVEYRLTVGEDFLVREQYESQAGPGYSTSGQLRKVTSRAYNKLSQGGFLRLTSHSSNRLGRVIGDLPRAN